MTAVLLMAQDGAFQPMVLQTVAPRGTTMYRLTGCVLRRVSTHDTAGSISTLAALKEHVFVFVSGSLETVNHRFLDVLAAEASQPDCGIALVRNGIFAVRRERLLSVGGLSAVSSERIAQVAQLLIEAAQNAGLRIVSCSEAVATP